MSLYGSILPLEVFYSVTFRRGYFFKIRVGMFNFVYDWFVTQFTTFWSGFGYQAVQLPTIMLGLLVGLTFLALWGLVLASWKRWWMAVLLGWGMYTGGLLQAHLRFPAFHAKDMYPALVPLTILWINGMATWWEKFMAGKLRWARLFLTLLWILGWYLLVRREVVFWWKYGGNYLATILFGYGIVMGLGVIWAILLFRFIHEKKAWRPLERHKKSVILVSALFVFLFNIVFLIRVVTPNLFGARNVSLEEWVHK